MNFVKFQFVFLRVTAATGIDAMVHAIGLYNTNSKSCNNCVNVLLSNDSFSKMMISNQYINKSISLDKFLLNISSFTDLFPPRSLHVKAQEKCFVRRAGQGDNVRKHKYECKVKHKNAKEAQVLMQKGKGKGGTHSNVKKAQTLMHRRHYPYWEET